MPMEYDETYETEAAVQQYGDLRLDDIMAMEEPARTHAIRAWVKAGQYGDAEIKLMTSDGKPLETDLIDRRTGKRVVVTHKGIRVPRIVAIDLLLKYGEFGLYRDRDQATGYTKYQWAQFKRNEPELAEALVERLQREPKFITNFLTHIPDHPVPAGVPVLRQREPQPVAAGGASFEALPGEDDEGVTVG